MQGWTILQVISSYFAIIFLVFVSGCQSASERFEQKAIAAAFTPQVIETGIFSHKIYKNHQLLDGKLHIYLTGDGLPWMAGVIPSVDPTPRDTIIFDLIEQDQSAALILGRPCYHGFSDKSYCDSGLWTGKRYSEDIVESLSIAVEQLSEQYRASSLVLIGYSGGGALAVLLAEKVSNVSAVITIGGNLNILLWTQHHQLLPLNGSMNPAERPGLPVTIMQKHFIGSEDKIVPASMLKTYVESHGASELVVVDGFDHRCCWKNIWAEILKQIP